jgi:hypothetical protein
MPKLELPADVARQVVGMLRVTAQPRAVLFFDYRVATTVDVQAGEEEDCMFFKVVKGLLSEAEGRLLKFEDTVSEFGELQISYVDDDTLDDFICVALSIGFEFRSSLDRMRWKKREPFELYREAVRGVA